MDVIDHSPQWAKSLYVKGLQSIKASLRKMGILQYVDRRAKTSQKYHYLRSLLALHQLEDMIALDVPWWTYDAIREVEAYIQTRSHPVSVFEYGSGASTVWLAKRCARVISIEHDELWFQELQSRLAPYPHVELHLKKPDLKIDEAKYRSKKAKGVTFRSYVTEIHAWDQLYDLIIIDGRCRAACLQESLRFLKPDGIILLDNSDRIRYHADVEKLGCMVQRFPGRVPGSPLKSETALLTRESRLFADLSPTHLHVGIV